MAPSTPTDADITKKARKAGIASFIGTTIEWYDFYIYGTAAALVFGEIFFASDLPAGVGTLLAFVTLWAGFLARPIGGVIFGHLGDRIGRKNTLVITLVMMGIATVGIGLLPTYAQIGIWLRFCSSHSAYYRVWPWAASGAAQFSSPPRTHPRARVFSIQRLHSKALRPETCLQPWLSSSSPRCLRQNS